MLRQWTSVAQLLPCPQKILSPQSLSCRSSHADESGKNADRRGGCHGIIESSRS
jgi:hypothetical protein